MKFNENIFCLVHFPSLQTDGVVLIRALQLPGLLMAVNCWEFHCYENNIIIVQTRRLRSEQVVTGCARISKLFETLTLI